MRTGPDIITNGLVFAVDPASNRTNYMQDIVNDTTGTAVGTPTTSSEGHKTVTFDANGEYYNYGSSNVTRGLGNITIMGWAKQSNTSQPHQTLFCTSTGYQYGLKLMSRYHGQWSAWIGKDGGSNYLAGSGNNITNVDEFYCICCTRQTSNGDILLYQDGVLVASKTNVDITGTITESGNTSYGNDYHSNGYYHAGKLGQVWVWDRVLSATEIQSMYNSTETRYK